MGNSKLFLNSNWYWNQISNNIFGAATDFSEQAQAKF